MYKTAHSPFKQTIMCKIKSCLCPQIESQDRACNIFIRTKKKYFDIYYWFTLSNIYSNFIHINYLINAIIHFWSVNRHSQRVQYKALISWKGHIEHMFDPKSFFNMLIKLWYEQWYI